MSMGLLVFSVGCAGYFGVGYFASRNELPTTASELAAMPDKSEVYSELVNVKGRVAIVTSTARGTDARTSERLRQSVKAFVDQLRADNAR